MISKMFAFQLLGTGFLVCACSGDGDSKEQENLTNPTGSVATTVPAGEETAPNPETAAASPAPDSQSSKQVFSANISDPVYAKAAAGLKTFEWKPERSFNSRTTKRYDQAGNVMAEIVVTQELGSNGYPLKKKKLESGRYSLSQTLEVISVSETVFAYEDANYPYSPTSSISNSSNYNRGNYPATPYSSYKDEQTFSYLKDYYGSSTECVGQKVATVVL